MSDSSESTRRAAPWLLLLHRVPPKPDYLRVKVRRRLHRIGAKPLKNSVYVLPNNDESLEDMSWLCRDIESEGGEAMICEASFVEGVSNDDVHALFTGAQGPVRAVRRAAARLRPRKGATWVTRRGVGIDRIASAWLVKRFVDPTARFKFVAPRGYRPHRGEVRFDMYDAEFTHEGERCTFEQIAKEFRLRDRAVRTLGAIVHDIDCKDAKFGRPETSGIALIIESITRAHSSDRTRLERGGAVFDDLYTRLRRT